MKEFELTRVTPGGISSEAPGGSVTPVVRLQVDGLDQTPPSLEHHDEASGVYALAWRPYGARRKIEATRIARMSIGRLGRRFGCRRKAAKLNNELA
jgi:hypothetical protein